MPVDEKVINQVADNIELLIGKVDCYVSTIHDVLIPLFGPFVIEPFRLPFDFLKNIAELITYVEHISECRSCKSKLDIGNFPIRNSIKSSELAILDAAKIFPNIAVSYFDDIEEKFEDYWVSEDVADRLKVADHPEQERIMGEFFNRYTKRLMIEFAFRIRENNFDRNDSPLKSAIKNPTTAFECYQPFSDNEQILYLASMIVINEFFKDISDSENIDKPVEKNRDESIFIDLGSNTVH